MNTLVLIPKRQSLRYAGFAGPQRQELFKGVAGPGPHADEAPLVATVRDRWEGWCRHFGGKPDLIAVRAVFGGETFQSPVRVTPEVVRELEELVLQAPLPVRTLLGVIEGLRQVAPEVPTILAFETAFFVSLPDREKRYGLDPELSSALALRRYGFHGIFHEAAYQYAVRQHRKPGTQSRPRTLSICWEPKPEVAAIAGGRPVMVTGGMTPLEGLPGETTCGELDPSVVLELAEQKRWGPEQIDNALSQGGGLTGLVGRPTTLGQVLRSENGALRLARRFLRYRLLQACGAGIAAMGGLDSVVLSGQFATEGKALGAWLVSRLSFGDPSGASQVALDCLAEPLARIIADSAAAAARSQACQGSVESGRSASDTRDRSEIGSASASA